MRKAICEFTVSGKGYFPLDMLRYDSCWPADGDSVSNLTFIPVEQEISKEEIREVILHTYGGVTMGRWLSFSWPVTDMKVA